MIPINKHYGIIVRKAALTERGLDEKGLFEILGWPHSEDDKLWQFAPLMGNEARETLIQELLSFGLQYWDDCFESPFEFPDWYELSASFASGQKR